MYAISFLGLVICQMINLNQVDSLTTALEKTNETLEKSKILIQLGDLYEHSDPEMAITYYKKSKKILTKIDRTNIDIQTQLAISIFYIGIVQKNTGKYKQAMENYHAALSIFEFIYEKTNKQERQKFLKYIANILNNIGNLHYLQNSNAFAIVKYQEALSIYQQLQDSMLIAGSWNNLGVVYEKLDSLDLAINNYQSALEIYQNFGHHRRIAISLSNIANVQRKMGLIDNAATNYFSSLEIRKKLNDQLGMAVVHNNLSQLYCTKKEYELAIQHAYKSIALADITGNLETLRHAYSNIANAYAELYDFKNAYHYQSKFISTNDTLLNIEKQKAILELENKYQTEKNEKENILLQQKLGRKNTIQIFLIILTFVLFIAVFLAFRVIRLRNKTIKLEKEVWDHEKNINNLELESKNRELSVLTLQIANKNEILETLLEKVQGLKKTHNVNVQIDDMYKTIKSNLNLDDQWEKFKTYFETVNQGFFDRLIQKYPDLTPNEQKLCAYLRINLSTKEISNMFNSSISAVNKSRQRLRKKFTISSDTNLVTFIQQI